MVKFRDPWKEQMQQEVAEKYALYKKVAKLQRENEKLKKEVDTLKKHVNIKI